MKFFKKLINYFISSHSDFLLLFLTLLMIVIGLTMILSSSSLLSYIRMGDGHFFIKRQIINLFISLLFFLFITIYVDTKTLKKYSLPLFLISLLLLLITLIPGIGVRISGSRRWLRLPFMRLQPSEFVKLTIIMFFAAFYDKNYKHIKMPEKHFIYFIKLLLVVVFVFIIIVIQPDYSTATIISGIAVSIIFIMGFKLKYFFWLLVGFVSLAALFIKISPYRMRRYLAYLNPWDDPLRTGYHIIQSYIAIVHGGIFGTGLGSSIQKYGYLPEVHTDFIFAIIAEEFGLILSVVLLFMFAVFVWLCFKITFNCRSNYFNFITAFGISMMFSIQILVNISVVTGLIPTTGVTLPFISYGGSSLMVSLIAVAILLKISKESVKG